MVEKKNIILSLIVVLVVFILFSAFRGGITTSATYCVECKLDSDCQDFCYDECITKGYDVVTSIGVVEDGKVNCECKCESYLNNLVRGK